MRNNNQFMLDLCAEQILANYLDDFYYPRLNDIIYERVHDMNNQHLGIDTILTQNNINLLIDEKGLLSIPKPINTFALELSYINTNGVRRIGWLFDEHKITTHYLLCWVKRNECNLQELQITDIHYVVALLISRQKLLSYLDYTYNINVDTLNTIESNILADGRNGRQENLSNTSKSRYHYSSHLPEAPINIVMDKNELLDSGAVISHHLVKRSSLDIK